MIESFITGPSWNSTVSRHSSEVLMVYGIPVIVSEKVSPAHPDKMCDRLAGAIVDLAYSKEHDPRIAVEVLAGHGKVFVIIETSLSREQLSCAEIDPIVWRIFVKDCPHR